MHTAPLFTVLSSFVKNQFSFTGRDQYRHLRKGETLYHTYMTTQNIFLFQPIFYFILKIIYPDKYLQI